MRDSTQTRYQAALGRLNSELEEQDVSWEALDNEERDYFLAEWLVDGYECGSSRGDYGTVLSALGRINPRLQLKISWKVFDTWSQLQPVQQAPSAPPEFITALIVACFAINRPELAMIFTLAYSGLLRISEVLGLTWADVILTSSAVILCLGQTKRGLEQKVVITNMTVVTWVGHYHRLVKLSSTPAREAKLFLMSYNSVLRWTKRLAVLLGFGWLPMTTHSFRRSGASQMVALGTSFVDVLLFGRWLSERAAREYVRKGEVGMVRARAQASPELTSSLAKWNSLTASVWEFHAVLFSVKGAGDVNLSRITDVGFVALQTLIFKVFGL